ncbi:glycosyltransferase family 2 protein [Lactobacillus amylovorus]|uniref:Glycosyltransferase family 2 protein n=1 Tax=Lactobacillus amylovorus TaxID=1604 RepID=A0A5E8CQS9_LACAM|nr:glycosyltransferase family 2 protein [Lactobacillus amylovorus]QDD71017.1 glycosyltransferase family 2 protein [Lactobacillus amylovorus]
MENKKILTVGIAAYNASTTLTHTLKSLLLSEILNKIEVIIVNDGSTDDTQKIAEKYVLKYPHTVRLINKKNGGHGSVINKLIQTANTPYLKLVDADDTVEKKGFVSLINCLENCQADVVLSPFYLANLKNNKKIEKGYLINNKKNFEDNKICVFKDYYKKLDPALHSITYKTELLRKSDFKVDEHCFYEDTEYALYYFLYAKSILMLDKPVYCYWIGNDGQSVNIENRLNRRNQALNIVLNMISFYENNKENMDRYKKIFYMNHISALIGFSYELLMALPSEKIAKSESKKFDTKVRKISPEIYQYFGNGDMGGRKIAKIIKLFRITNWNGYFIVYKALNSSMVNRIKMV